MSIADDYLALGLPRGASPGTVRAAWQAMATRLHPDHGGDAEQFHIMRGAYRRALHHASQLRPCGVCLGSGSVTLRNGFSTALLRCKACRGKGKIIPQ